MGAMTQEKIKEIYFSGAGNLLATIELEGLTKHSLNFYMIAKVTEAGPQSKPGQKSDIDTYEFRKTARYEVKEKKWVCKWDENGRFFVMHGKKSSTFDKTVKGIKFFNMFGELIECIEDVLGLDNVHFRPRARDILK